MLSLESQFAHNLFSNCFMNASGVNCMDETELQQLDNSAAATYITKSATLQARQGNPQPRYFDTALGSINSMGLPNQGLDYYLNYVLGQQEIKPNKTLFISISGLSLEENLAMLEKIASSGFNGYTELNLSCPNVPGKPQTGYDFAQTTTILTEAMRLFHKPLGVKLPPYFDLVHFQQMAAILNKFPLTFVNCINSIGNALYIDIASETVTIKPKDGFGGIGGDYVKPTALANVRMFYKLLRPEITIIGTGGIKNGSDAFEHLLCGASLLQIGTQLHKEGPTVFSRIGQELNQIMQAKGYQHIAEFKGKLKTL